MLSLDERGFYESLKNKKRPLFLCHKNADPDSFGSAYALMRLFGGDIGVSDSLSALAGALALRLKTNVIESPAMSKYDIVVVVDTSNSVQAGISVDGACALIDHHAPGDLNDRCGFGISRQASSTAEIVYGVYRKNGVLIDKDVALALLLGMVTDTGNFRYAGPGAFETAASILKDSGMPYAEVSEFLSGMPMELSCRIAMLKAASRMTLTREGDYMIVTTKVSSFGGQAATSLITLGADVVFVGSEKEGEKRISGRARRGVGIDLATLLSEIGEKHGEGGGGHAAAAGAVIKGDLDRALKECESMAIKSLKK